MFYGGSLRLFVDSELDQNRACVLNVAELVFFPILFVLYNRRRHFVHVPM